MLLVTFQILYMILKLNNNRNWLEREELTWDKVYSIRNDILSYYTFQFRFCIT